MKKLILEGSSDISAAIILAAFLIMMGMLYFGKGCSSDETIKVEVVAPQEEEATKGE